MWKRIGLSLKAFCATCGWLTFVWLAGMLTGMTGFILQFAFGLDPHQWSLSLWLPASFLVVVVVTFIAFHRQRLSLQKEIDESRDEAAELKSESISINTEPQFDKHIGYWRILVHNGSKKTITLALRLVSTNPSYGLPLPMNLQITHLEKHHQIDVGPGDDQLFDLCAVRPRGHTAIVILGAFNQMTIPYQKCELTVSAFTTGTATDTCRFTIDQNPQGQWIVSYP